MQDNALLARLLQRNAFLASNAFRLATFLQVLHFCLRVKNNTGIAEEH